MAPLTDYPENGIMVVDDTESMALCVKAFLNVEGYARIETFGCPAKALDRIREQGCPAVIISDYEMPVMNGADFLDSVLRQYPHASGVIMTGHSAVPPDVTARFSVIRKNEPDFFGLLLRHVRDELASEGPHIAPP
ncbi:MAG: response regulator [Chitinispirillaceae bacterium]|nr:response regulator [Chitinispirillaceae bacterium]